MGIKGELLCMKYEETTVSTEHNSCCASGVKKQGDEGSTGPYRANRLDKYAIGMSKYGHTQLKSLANSNPKYFQGGIH